MDSYFKVMLSLLTMIAISSPGDAQRGDTAHRGETETVTRASADRLAERILGKQHRLVEFLADFEDPSNASAYWFEWVGPSWDGDAAMVGQGAISIVLPGDEGDLSGQLRMEGEEEYVSHGSGACPNCNMNPPPPPPPGGDSMDRGSNTNRRPMATVKTAGAYSWYVNVDDLDLEQGDSFVLFELLRGGTSGLPVAQVEIRYDQSTYQVRHKAEQFSGTVAAGWQKLGSAPGPLFMVLKWKAAGATTAESLGSAELTVVRSHSSSQLAASSSASLITLDNSNYDFDFLRWGLLEPMLHSMNGGTLELDHFTSYYTPSLSAAAQRP